MSGFKITSNVKEFVERMAIRPYKLHRELEVATIATGVILLNVMQENASHRPGPEVRTGHFRNAMRVYVDTGQLLVIGYNNDPQAARLEYGFVGEDSEGRMYHQPPYPWLAPSMEAVRPVYEHLIEEAVRNAMA